jgi:hypothetical protein
MNHSNRDRTPVGAEHVVERLNDERVTASPLELDRLKLQAIQQAERARPSLYARKKGTLMKSRLALTLVLVAGFMFSTTGATLAISGSSGSGSAATNQYVSPTNEGNHGVKGENAKGGEESNNTLTPTTTEEVGPVATEQVAVASEDSGSLPFTGFLAIPLLVIGLGLILVGVVIRLKSRNAPPVA